MSIKNEGSRVIGCLFIMQKIRKKGGRLYARIRINKRANKKK